MAHSKQAKKRIRQNDKARLRNKARRSSVRTYVKKVQAAVGSGDKAKALEELRTAQQSIAKAGRHRVVHPNNAARQISALARQVAAMA